MQLIFNFPRFYFNFVMGQHVYSVILKYVILFFTHFILQASTKALNCTFDADFCGWIPDKDDDFDWKMDKGIFIKSPTGPMSDHTKNGYYIYIDATNQTEGYKARIKSPIQAPGPHCFTFWYSMHGQDFGALNIYMYLKNVTGGKPLIFSKDRPIGSPRWQKAVISRKANVKFQVVIEGVRGKDVFSDIAVDDISMTDGMCTFDCDFGFGMCHWVQDQSDGFDWIWHQGGTSTPNKGPPGDNTSGGNYIYIDTNAPKKCTSAHLLSPWLSEGKYCFSFRYKMCKGKLIVQKVDVDKNTSEIIKITEQKQQWIPENVFIHATSGFQIIIEGTVRDKKRQADIAVDDLQMLSCQDCADPTPTYGSTNSTFFQYSSIVQITCNSGYTIKGDPIINCMSEEKWSGSPTCEPVDCADPTPTYGRTNSSNFQYKSIVQIMCNSGYTIKGDQIINCTSEGQWSGSPYCEPVDCADPTPKYGSTNSSNFQYKSIVQITCNSGYTIKGDQIINCTSEGKWSGSPNCDPMGSVNSNALTVVYIVVPLVAVALIIFIIMVFWRKVMHMCLGVRGTHEQTKPTFSNAQSNHEGLNEDTEYAVITDDRNERGQDSQIDDFNAADDAITTVEKIENIYNHTKTTRTPVIDDNYSHITGNKDSFASNYDQTSIQHSGTTSIQSSTNLEKNRYEVLNFKNPTESCSLGEQPDLDSEYDHAGAGCSEPIALDYYSHLNKGQINLTPKILEKDSKLYSDVNTKDLATNNEYEQSMVEKQEYFVLEPHSIDTVEDERHYFVLEKEDN